MFHLSEKEKAIVLFLLLAFLVGWFYREATAQSRARAAEIELKQQLKSSNAKSELP
ncbi:MAG: hypothetical protein ACK5NG_09725 [Chthoniobacterales bacterium]